MDMVQELKDMRPTRDFFVGIDSDGCVFDTMELKHKECFCPAFIKHFGLQGASRYARAVWDFVNLYSTTRGCNRFLGVQRALALMAEWDIFAARGIEVGPLPALDAWLREETKLGNPALERKVAATGDPALKRLLAWTKEVNERVKDMVHGVTPFSGVRRALDLMRGRADIIVVSQTPYEALRREWDEHGLSSYARAIAGQEAGTKGEHLRFAAGGKYDPGRVLMVGDAPGDGEAARENGFLFFPIVPGDEESSWKRLCAEGLPRFFEGTYAGAYAAERLAAFAAALPEQPPWRDASPDPAPPTEGRPPNRGAR